MSPQKAKSVSEGSPSFNAWDVAIGLIACAIVFVFPLFPDEKLVRLKLEALEIGIFIFALVVGLRTIVESLPSIKTWPATIYAILSWVLVTAIFVSTAKEKSQAIVEWRRVLLAATAFISFSFAALSADWKRRFLLTWIFSGTLAAVYGLLQFTGGVGPIGVPQMARIMSTFGNSIFFAAFLSLTIFVVFAAISSERVDEVRWLLCGTVMILVVAFYHAQSRAGWLAFGVAFLVGILAKFGRRKIPPAVWLVVFFTMGVFYFKTEKIWKRDQAHLLIWRDTVRMWKDHPVAGVGLGAFHTNFPKYAQSDLVSKWPPGQFIVNEAHNEYLQTLAEAGIIGLCAFLIIPILFFISERPWNWLTIGVLGSFLQNFFSVDMRFGVSLANTFMLMGLVSSQEPEQRAASKKLNLSIPRVLLAAAWIVFLVGVVWPRLMRPYRAQKEVAASSDFFDQRLLDPTKTVEDLERLAETYPNEPAVFERLAYVYAKQIKMPDNRIDLPMTTKAIATYERLIELDPRRMGAYNNLANIYYTIGRVPNAIQTWQRALAVNPDFTDIHLNLGKVLFVQGKLKEAAEHFESVLKKDPSNAEAIVYMKRMVE